ncbi:MAG TPA: phosphatase PAP2 family protein [Gemmatimonadales bacterium]|nr:phosphatase PAP2 family protein [Gemmatimonadales bacterium]
MLAEVSWRIGTAGLLCSAALTPLRAQAAPAAIAPAVATPAAIAPAVATPADIAPAPVHAIRWYEAAGAVAATSTLMLIDEPVERSAQEHRSETSNHIASAFRHVGQVEVFAPVSAALIVTGLVAHRPALVHTGARAVASVGLAGGSTLAIKEILGRERPAGGVGAFDFDPLSHDPALPSGHVAVAFALATSLADDIHRTWATVGLYTVATGVVYSRINDDKHWLSDTGFGALVGFTSAKLVRGRWRVFGIRPPTFLRAPGGGAAIGWQFTQ